MIDKDMITLQSVLFSMLSGVLLTLSFPPFGLGFIAYFAFLPLLRAVGENRSFVSFRLGLISGLTHYLTLIYWVVFVLGHYGGLDLITSSCILALFSFYLSLYPAVFCSLLFYIKKSPYPVLLSAGIWVSLEYFRAKIFSGFPWCLSGYSQADYLILIQIADIAGVYGLSFIIMSINVFFSAVISGGPFNFPGRHIKWETLIMLFLVLATVGYGYHRLYNHKKVSKGPGINIALIQGNIDQSIKWSEEYQEKTLNAHIELSRSVYDLKPDLIIWPETSVPFFFQEETPLRDEILEVSRQSGANLIFGSPAYEVRNDGSTKYYNRVYSLSPDGVIKGKYDKVHLVPFGEYVPEFLPFIGRLVQAAGDFEPGREITPIISSGISLGILICFEVIFPELSCKQTEKGAEILINLTNDAWFGKTGAPYQHLSMAVFRAVENRKPLIRAANTGFSAFIGPDGDIIERSRLFTKTVMTRKIGVDSSELTFYTQNGNKLILLIVFLSLMLLLYSVRKHNKEKKRWPTV